MAVKTAILIAIIGMCFFQIVQLLQPSPTDKVWLFFDGVCNLCDGFVNFVADHDSQSLIKFGALQNHETLLKEHGAPTDLSTVVLIHNGNVYTHSSAALRVLAALDAPINQLSAFYFIPAMVRDWVYRLVAKHRYNVFGRVDECRKPSKDFESRFLDYAPNPLTGQ